LRGYLSRFCDLLAGSTGAKDFRTFNPITFMGFFFL
jgi:hypothetical protein